MESVANVGPAQLRDLPARAGYGLAARELLELPSLAGSILVAGARGGDQLVSRVNVMEVPDILPWVKPNELLLTTGFSLRHADSGRSFDADELVSLVEALAARGVAALGIKSGRYLDEVPTAMIVAADRLGFPLLTLPHTVAFDEVISEVFAQLVDRQSSVLDTADRLHQALTAIVLEGGDLPQLAEEVATLFDSAVLICSPDGRVQTMAGPAERTQALRELPLFDPSGRLYTERLLIGVQPAPHHAEDTGNTGNADIGGGGQVAVAQVAAAGTDHGRIVAYRPEGFAPVIVQALERAATVAALAITKQLAVSAVESKFRGDYLRDALAGNAGPDEQVVAHCAELGWDVHRPLAVLVAVLDDDGTLPPAAGRTAQARFVNAWQQVVRIRDRSAPVVGFSHEVVVLLPASTETVGAVVADLVAAVAGDRGGGRHSFSAGISRVVGCVTDLPVAYDQARKAVVVGRRIHGEGAVAHFDSLGVHRLLSLVSDSGELRSFAAEVLGRLGGDSPEFADLRHTLQTLLDTNCNVAETARALHFHYNTLRYRIGKLESMVGPFTSDPNLRLDVALALRVVQMRGL